MKTYTQDEVNKIVALHDLWLRHGTGGVRADFSDADLSYIDLSHINLRYAIFCNANLHHTDISFTDLTYTDLAGANFYFTDLDSAHLRGANLLRAKVRICGKVVKITSRNFELFLASRHWGFRVGPYLKIGCQEHTLEHWDKEVENIASNAHYSKLQIAEYAGKVRELCARVKAGKMNKK